MFHTTTFTEDLDITQLGDDAYVAYQRQLEDTRAQPTAPGGGANFDLTPPF
jgi:hypothetical protein